LPGETHVSLRTAAMAMAALPKAGNEDGCKKAAQMGGLQRTALRVTPLS
jgi:hypothetical protein